MKRNLFLFLSMAFLTSCGNKFEAITEFTKDNSKKISLFSYNMTMSNSNNIFTHIATVNPTTLNGKKLQATGFDKDGLFAFISYNTRGEEIRGGLDIISLTNLNTPTLISSLVSENSEYAELKRNGSYLFMVGQKRGNDRNFALLTVIDVSNKSNPQVVSEMVFNNGWYATSIDIKNNKAFINIPGVGIKTINISNPLNLVDENTSNTQVTSLFSRRLNDKNIVIGGNNSLKVFTNDSSSDSNSLIIKNQEQEAPSRFILTGNKLISNAGDSGLSIIKNIDTTSVMISNTNLLGRGNGLSLGSCNTLYLAQGDQGLLAYDISNLNSPNKIGRFDFADQNDDMGSANNSFYLRENNNQYVFVADGLGGVKIVKITSEDGSCSCEDEMEENDDDIYSNGLSCKVYDLTALQPAKIPNLSTMTPISTFNTNIFNVVSQSYLNSLSIFPDSLKYLKEWYAISCEGKWKSTEDGDHTFSLGSDDGSKLFIDNTLLIDNDGQHAPLTKTQNLTLSKKVYNIKLEYFQGPRTQIQLELKYKKTTESNLKYMTNFFN